jgi:hypothetical protein
MINLILVWQRNESKHPNDHRKLRKDQLWPILSKRLFYYVTQSEVANVWKGSAGSSTTLRMFSFGRRLMTRHLAAPRCMHSIFWSTPHIVQSTSVCSAENTLVVFNTELGTQHQRWDVHLAPREQPMLYFSCSVSQVALATAQCHSHRALSGHHSAF